MNLKVVMEIRMLPTAILIIQQLHPHQLILVIQVLFLDTAVVNITQTYHSDESDTVSKSFHSNSEDDDDD